MEFKDVPAWGLKSSSDGWSVTGYASTFWDSPDTYGDVIAAGAFADSLRTRPKVPLLWGHDAQEPIGKVISLREDAHGLLGHWSLVPTAAGTKAHQLLEHELIDSLSIGFLTKDAEYRDDGTRLLKTVELVEVSLVVLPANSSAVVTAWKSARAGDPAALRLRLALTRRRLKHAGVPLLSDEAERLALRLALLRRQIKHRGVPVGSGR